MNQYTYGSVPMTVLPGTKNQYDDEFLVGAEYEVKPDFTVGVYALSRSLGEVLEDTAYISGSTTRASPSSATTS